MTAMYDLKDRNTEEDFDTLIRGLFSLAQKHGYGWSLKSALQDRDFVAEKVRNYVHVTASVETRVDPSVIGGEMPGLARKIWGESDDSQAPVSVVVTRQGFVLKMDEGDILDDHEDSRCAKPRVARDMIAAIMFDRMADQPGALHSRVSLDDISMICSRPGCPGIL